MAIDRQRIRSLVVRSGLYRPVMFLRRQVRRHEIDRLREGVAFFRQVVRPGDLAFDIGANTGNTAEILLAAGARVVSAEPVPDCVAELRARFGRNRNFTLVPKAVGAAEGTATLNVSVGTTFLSSLRDDWGIPGERRKVEVPVTTLDALIAVHGVPRFLKVDVEGFEAEVLAGLSRPVPLVSFEYHGERDGYGRAVACVDRLRALSPIRLNLSGQEAWSPALADWMEPEAFKIELKGRVDADPSAYGDVLVRREGD